MEIIILSVLTVSVAFIFGSIIGQAIYNYLAKLLSDK